LMLSALRAGHIDLQQERRCSTMHAGSVVLTAELTRLNTDLLASAVTVA